MKKDLAKIVGYIGLVCALIWVLISFLKGSIPSEIELPSELKTVSVTVNGIQAEFLSDELLEADIDSFFGIRPILTGKLVLLPAEGTKISVQSERYGVWTYQIHDYSNTQLASGRFNSSDVVGEELDYSFSFEEVLIK